MTMIHSIQSAVMSSFHYCKEYPRVVVYMAMGGVVGALLPVPSLILKISLVVLGILIGRRIFVAQHTSSAPGTSEIIIDLYTHRAQGREEAERKLRSLLEREALPADSEYREECSFLRINPGAIRNLWNRELWGAITTPEIRLQQFEEILQTIPS